MFTKSTLSICRRFYNTSRSNQRKLPSVKIASSRIGKAIKERADFEVTSNNLTRQDPSKYFEPFPFAVTEENKVDILKRLITPLHDTPYEEQLQSKESFCKNALRYFAQQLYKNGTPVRLDVRRLPCTVNPIVKAPELHQYRNKDEFSIWTGHDGKTNTIGYMAFPMAKHGDTVCIEPNGCTIMKDETVRMVDILQDFIRNQAKLGICKSLGHEGGWRRFMIRINSSGELMVVGIASPVTLRVSEVVDERENFKNYVVEKSKEAGLKLKSLYFQPCPHNKCLHKNVPYELLYGTKTITESINQFSFVISPESSIHTSSAGAGVLYKTIRATIDECFGFDGSKRKPLVIDVGCGIGALGIHLADLAEKVIGIDVSSQAVEDSIYNAKANGIDNFEGINANLEIVLERVLDTYAKNNLETMIVCNPSVPGLHPNVVRAMRNCYGVKKIVYTCSKADRESVVENWMVLCQKEPGKSTPPFLPVSATPVDLYPQLPQCELVLAFERVPH